MNELRYTLLTDGSSDRALIPILNWLLQVHLEEIAIQPQWADLQRIPKHLRSTLCARIQQSIALYPCELLFVHRDAERNPRENRVNEIYAAMQSSGKAAAIPVVCVIPVRMSEAWLLFNEPAIRRAAGNPNGKESLELPALKRLEDLPDPKAVLYELLCQASGLSSRRKFRPREHVHRIAELIGDFSPLRALPAFSALEDEVVETIERQSWTSRN